MSVLRYISKPFHNLKGAQGLAQGSGQGQGRLRALTLDLMGSNWKNSSKASQSFIVTLGTFFRKQFLPQFSGLAIEMLLLLCGQKVAKPGFHLLPEL
jgi:hypothetical protein